jgi:hypothetical protein
LAEPKVWPALRIESAGIDLALPDLLSGTLDEFSPMAIQDLAELPLPPTGLWDPTCPAAPDPPILAIATLRPLRSDTGIQR